MSNEKITTQMNTFTDTLKAGLDAGETYVDLINQLIETDDAEQLLGAANKLSVYELKNDFVKYPFQYQPQDYYLVLASRLLQFHNNESLETSIDDAGAVSARLNQLGNSAKFQFVMDKSKNGGALFTETKTNEALFYLNLQKRMMRFNNRSLVNLFVEKLSEVTTIIQIQQAINPLMTLAHYLQTDLGFSVDLGILDTSNAAKYYLLNKHIGLEVIDKLFVSTEGTDYMLMNLTNETGMSLQMDSNSKLTLSSGRESWAFSVSDEKEAVSFFDILIRFKLIRTWFMDNRASLEIKSDPMIFKE